MGNCIFCKIINKEIPSKLIYEDKYVMAFLDIGQLTKGHTLVIPKKHFTNLLDVSPKYLKKVILRVQKIAQALMRCEGVKGINIFNNNEVTAGQSVMHLHFHVVPRYDEKEFQIPTPCENKFSEEEINKIKDLIINYL